MSGGELRATLAGCHEPQGQWWSGGVRFPACCHTELGISGVVLSYPEKPDYDGHLLLEVDCSAARRGLLN